MLRDAGVGVIEYTEQLTYLLFLKMAHERAIRKLAPQQIVPEEYSWQRLLDADGQELETVYSTILRGLASQPGTLGTIYRKSQNRVQDPALLKKLVVDLIGQENWSAGGTNFTGDVYEELLSKGASDQGSGAGQYFTPRELIRAIVDVVQPTPKESVVDPACGTGSLIEVRDALIADPGKRWPVVLTNPPLAEIDAVWKLIKRHAGEEFQTINGLAFTYVVPGNFLRVTRDGEEISRSLSRANFEKSLDIMPADGPGALKGRQGPSYTWAILMDRRIRLADW